MGSMASVTDGLCILAAMSDVIERTETLAAGPRTRWAGCSAFRCLTWRAGPGCRCSGTGAICLTGPAQADLGPDGHPVRGSAARAAGARAAPDVGGRPGARLRGAALRRARHQADPGALDDRQGRADRADDVRRRRPPDRAARSGGRRRGAGHRLPRAGRRRAGFGQRHAAGRRSSRRATASGRSRSRRPCCSASRPSPITRTASTTTAIRPRRRGVPGPADPRPAAGAGHGGGRPRGRGLRRGRPAAPGRERSFEYRLVSPLFDHQGMVVSAVPGEEGATGTAVRDRYGRQTATGTLR